MKKFSVILALILFASLGVTATVLAGTPAQRFPVPDITVPVVNPCNNLPVAVTWTDLTLLTRTGEDANGGSHIVFTLEGSITDTTGFSNGQFLFTSHTNGSLPDNFETTEHFTVVARNPETHQAIVLHDTAHITVKDGAATVDISVFDETCVGNPN